MKRKSPRTCQSSSFSPRSAKQISESFSTNEHYIKRNPVHYVNLKQAIEKWRLNCFFSKKLTFVTETSFHLKE